MRKAILLSADESNYNDLLIDVVKDASGMITQGLVIGETDSQNVDIIVNANKGEIKEYPTLGVGLIKYVKSVNKERELVREVSVQLEQDGYKAKITMDSGVLNIKTD